MKAHHKGRVASLIALAIMTVVAILVVVYRQDIRDQLSVWGYQPTAEISGLAERTTMTPLGKHYFYASHPEVQDRTQFNASCTSKEHSSAILGCYNGLSIYLYDVTDDRLDGVREVTAAHEMLHAAYARLSSSERERVDALLQKEYDVLKKDTVFRERMSLYDSIEPNEQMNELHSIIGTEVGSIGSELEAYYGKYFQNRSVVVKLYHSYESVFTQLKTRADELTKRLDSLSAQINQDTATYNKQIAKLNKDISTFNARATSGDFASQADFQAQRQELVARSSTLQSLREAVNASVKQYNTYRSELQSIATQSDSLNRSIDSTLAPVPSV